MSDTIIDDQFLKQFRERLVAEGAVNYFQYPTENDILADKAVHGIPWGIPGSGLYRLSDKRYQMRADAEGVYSGVCYGAWTHKEWMEKLTANEPRAIFKMHRIEKGFASQTISGRYHHVIIEFEIEAAHE